MIDAQEAIKGLNGFTESLVSLIALLGAKMFEEESSEQKELLAQVTQKQTDGRWFARSIMKELQIVGTGSDQSGDLTGLSAAIQRYLVADSQALEAIRTENKVAAPNSDSAANARL